VVKKRCYSFFSKAQQRQLQTTHGIAQYKKIKTSMYIYDDNEPLPTKFKNTFTWKGDYMTIEDNHNNFQSQRLENTSDINLSWSSHLNTRWMTLSSYLISIEPIQEYSTSFLDNYFFNIIPLIEDLDDTRILKQDQKKDEAQSARSGHFNTLPKRPKIDKFKHRCSTKIQQYR
jgi:hypothetical protein